MFAANNAQVEASSAILIGTGIQNFDSLIDGGFPKSSITLVSGTPGTGKSIFCAQLLFNNALKGKKCLFLNLEQAEGKLEHQMLQFGWDINKVKKTMKIATVDSSNPDMVEYVLDEIKRSDYDLIALDSLDSISSTPIVSDEMKLSMDKIAETVVPTLVDTTTIGRLKLKKIFNAVSKSTATSFLTSERVEGALGISRDTISEFLCDCILVLHYFGAGAIDFRSMQIAKMRLSNHEKKAVPFEITKKGIEIYKEK